MTYAQLYRKTDEVWQNLPDWCHFIIDLGYCIAQYKATRNQTVVALALPTRNYSAILTAFGIILAQTKTFSQTASEHINNLKKGDIVEYKYPVNKWGIAIYKGIDVINNKGCIKIQIPLEQSRKFFRSSQEMTIYIPINRISVSIKAHQNNSINCLVIGTVNKLEEEYQSLIKSVCIVDKLKFRRLKAVTYNSEVLSLRRSKPEDLNIKILPNIVLFDGANAFLKCREYWLKSHTIVLLDRTEPHFQEAVDIINQDYCTRLNDDVSVNQLTPPFGVEIIAYQKNY